MFKATILEHEQHENYPKWQHMSTLVKLGCIFEPNRHIRVNFLSVKLCISMV